MGEEETAERWKSARESTLGTGKRKGLGRGAGCGNADTIIFFLWEKVFTGRAYAETSLD
jgi:hypothetical protein